MGVFPAARYVIAMSYCEGPADIKLQSTAYTFGLPSSHDRRGVADHRLLPSNVPNRHER